jgi:hypothetical protein
VSEFHKSITAPNAARTPFVQYVRCLAGTAHGDLWSEKSFANVSEVAGNSRIKMGADCKTTSGKSTAYPKNR